MFDLNYLRSPLLQKKEFLQEQEIGPQKLSNELLKELENLKSESKLDYMEGKFWISFIKAYPIMTLKIILLRSLGAVALLLAVLASERIILPNNPISLAWLLLIAFSIAQVAYTFLIGYSRKIETELVYCVIVFFTSRINNKIIRTGQNFSQKFSTGRLKVLISSDALVVGTFINTAFQNGIPFVIVFIIIFPFIIMKMGIGGVLGLLSIFIGVLSPFIWSSYLKKLEGRIKVCEDTMATVLGEWLLNIRLTRYLGWVDNFRSQIGEVLKKLMKENLKHQLTGSIFGFSTMNSFWIIPIIVMLLYQIQTKQPIKVISFFAVIWLFTYLYGYMENIPDVIIQYASAQTCVKRWEEIINSADMDADILPNYQEHDILSLIPKKIQLQNVSFDYENQKVLKNINLEIDLDQSTSLIGRVAAGKSTLLKVICGDLKPTEGEILIIFDTGLKINLWHENVWNHFRSYIGYVPQEPYISNTTVETNISLDEIIDEANVMQCLFFSGLEADINNFSNGLKEKIGEHGINLSGGQKQRVNLARAIYFQRKYLVLDDPLRAVDVNMEATLMDNIFNIAPKFFLSSHRLSELNRTNRLLVLEDGRIIEDGDPKLLSLNTCSHYYQHLNY